MRIADHSHKTLTDLYSLHGRSAVVTGGAQGIGAQTARRLAEAGANVVIGDVNIDGARHVAAELTELFGVSCRAIQLDVTDSVSLAAAANLAVDQPEKLALPALAGAVDDQSARRRQLV